jgi:hypothetical protein
LFLLFLEEEVNLHLYLFAPFPLLKEESPLLFTCHFSIFFTNLLQPPPRGLYKMVSRKKAKGKARKVAKAAKAAEEAEVAAVNGRQEGERSLELEAQMQRLSIGNLLRCRHGSLASSSHDERLCTEIMNAVKGGWRTHYEAGNSDFISCFNAGIDAAQEKYAALFDDVAKMEMLVSHCVAMGSKAVLDGDDFSARRFTTFACYFEQYNLVHLKETQFEVKMKWMQIIELYQCRDSHSLVKYLRKRIPCSCLDMKYKEVKSLPRFGMCCNPACTLPYRQVQRSKMFSCSGCDEMHYCCHQCQKADWPRHKEWCKQGRVVRGELRIDVL